MKEKTGGKRLEKLILSIREPIRGGGCLMRTTKHIRKTVRLRSLQE